MTDENEETLKVTFEPNAKGGGVFEIGAGSRMSYENQFVEPQLTSAEKNKSTQEMIALYEKHGSRMNAALQEGLPALLVDQR